MQTFRNLKDGKRKYLLIPVMPTPNGGMHLGHLSGPFLKMDVLARAQRRNGNSVSLFFGSDVYESYMNLKTWQTGKDEVLLCEEYHARIKGDMDALMIGYDAFINPLDNEHQEDFAALFTTVLNKLVAKGATEVRPEKYLYAKDEDCFVAGCWIQGQCPVCGSGSGSYQCEDCGTQYRPMDLINPSFRRGDYPLTTIDDKELYLVVRKKELFRHLENMQVSDEFIEMVKMYFYEQGEYIRLTSPGTWGIPWKLEGSKVPHVIFTYSALYFFSLYCGELYKRKYRTLLHPFEEHSGVITVASFGKDTTIPYLAAGVALGLEAEGYRPIDFLLPNHFLTLENDKFSTSRQHAIWGSNIVNKTPVSVDAIRYFLVLHNPEYAMTDFSVDVFLQFANEELANGLQPIITSAVMAMKQDSIADADEELAAKLERLLMGQNTCLTPPDFELKESSLPLKAWINYGADICFDAGTAYWWLKGFALLAFPVMPVCATAAWLFLGHEAEPIEKDFFLKTEVNADASLPVFFKRIGFEDIRPALPATLFTNEVEC